MRKGSVHLFLVLALTLAASRSANRTGGRHSPFAGPTNSSLEPGRCRSLHEGLRRLSNTTFVGQTVQYGYATILDRYKKLYATPAAMGKLTFSHLAIRILDADYAVATGNFHLERTAAGGGNADGIFSLLFKTGFFGLEDHSGPHQPDRLTLRSAALLSSLLRHISSMRLISSSVSF